MKVPKTIRKYCPHCKAYTEHKVVIVRPKIQRGGLGWGARKAREGKKGKGNHGKFSKRPMSQRKRYNAKTSKGADIRLICTQCGKGRIMEVSGRFKKIELSAAIKK